MENAPSCPLLPRVRNGPPWRQFDYRARAKGYSYPGGISQLQRGRKSSSVALELQSSQPAHVLPERKPRLALSAEDDVASYGRKHFEIISRVEFLLFANCFWNKDMTLGGK